MHKVILNVGDSPVVPLQYECQRRFHGFAQRVFPPQGRTRGDRTGWGRRREWLQAMTARDDRETEHVEGITDEQDVASALTSHQRGNAGHGFTRRSSFGLEQNGLDRYTVLDDVSLAHRRFARGVSPAGSTGHDHDWGEAATPQCNRMIQARPEDRRGPADVLRSAE